jgi:hypothetical protein
MLTALVALGSFAVEPVAAVAQTTTTTMSVDPTSIDYHESYTLHATVTPDGPAGDGSDPSGTVYWHLYVSQMNQPVIASAPLAEGETEVSASPGFVPQPGVNKLYAEFDPADPSVWWFSNSELVDLTVGQAPSTTTLEGPSAAELNSEISLTATVDTPVSDSTGSVNVYEVGNPTPLCTVATNVPSSVFCHFTAGDLGTSSYFAEYTGGTKVSDSESDQLAINITEDVVHARDFAVEFATFYPVSDGYRDTVDISGFRDEDISGTVKIYKPSGALIKTFTIPFVGGFYSVTWNGRNDAGTVYPEGKYKIVHGLEDGNGNTKTVTQYVTLSKKKLIWHSDTITKNGSAFTAKGKDGDGSVAVNSANHSVRLRTPDGFGGDWSAVGYQFSLKGIAWKAVKVGVLTTRGLVGGPVARVGAQDFDDCSYVVGSWSEGCFDTWKSIDFSNSKIWTSTQTLAARHVANGKVRSLVSNGSGTTYIFKARVVYKYATLGY